MSTKSEFFKYEGRRLAFRSFGSGPRVIVLTHGILMDQRMDWPLAEELAKRGNRVITMDLLGHGESDQPRDMTLYSINQYAASVLALCDHLGLDQVVVGGTSLGANVSLTIAQTHPERLRGMLLEMPVLDNAILGSATSFTPLLLATTFGAPITRAMAMGLRMIPRGLAPNIINMGLDIFRREPRATASVIQGVFFGRIAPPTRERVNIKTPALIVGHHRDPIHPFSDSDRLLDELDNAKLLEAESILELRTSPERLTGEIGDFLDGCWKLRPVAGSGRKSGARGAAKPAVKSSKA